MKSGAMGGMQMDMMRADRHVPLGVMGGNTMIKGTWMVTYRYMRMEMGGNLIGDTNVTPEQIATTVPNRFFGLAGQPITLRVVPIKMTTDMHLFGAMYAPTDRTTLMGMIPYLEREMNHITFAGGAGTTSLGSFTTKSNGIGDAKLMALFSAWDSGAHKIHLNAGLSLPTGSIDEQDDVLAPIGTRPTLRLPYPMQLGSGTFDAMPGITYKGHFGDFGWGAQYMGAIRLGKNDEGYALGDVHQLSGWASYSWARSLSTSLRITGRHTGSVDGIDPLIVAPVQTANPAFQGGERVDIGLGINFSAQKGVRAALELLLPVHQDLNGPQMEADWVLTAGAKLMF